jgi:hypothetical protein
MPLMVSSTSQNLTQNLLATHLKLLLTESFDADAAAALQVLAWAVLEYLGKPLEEAVEGTVPSIDTPHSTPAGLEPGEIPSAPRRNLHVTLPATRPRCKSPQYHDRHIRSYNPSPGPGPEQQRQFWTLRTLNSKPLSGSRSQQQGHPRKEALLVHGFTHRICQFQHLSALRRGLMHIHLEVPQLSTEVPTPDLLPHQTMQR